MQLIDDLLNLSRVTSSVLQSESVDLSAIARSIADELTSREPERKVEFVITAAEKVDGDPQLLKIVLDNLLRNSWKYTSAHPSARIEFGSRREDGRTVYFVSDDGAGFDPRSADRLFQPFQRLHPTAEFPGNGVGLATVQRIVRRHGGEIWAKAEVEQGQLFIFGSRPPLTAFRQPEDHRRVRQTIFTRPSTRLDSPHPATRYKDPRWSPGPSETPYRFLLKSSPVGCHRWF